MDKQFLITSNLEKKYILLNLCGHINGQAVRELRLEIIPLLELFDQPISLIVDTREMTGNVLDAIDELRQLWADYERTSVGQIIRIFKDELDDQGTKITDQFHLKSIRKVNVTRMNEAIRYCESFSEAG